MSALPVAGGTRDIAVCSLWRYQFIPFWYPPFLNRRYDHEHHRYLSGGADATIKPVNIHRVGVEIEGISLSELVESVDDTPELLDVIGEKNIARWISTRNKLDSFLDYFDHRDVADWLEIRVSELQQED